MAQTETWAVYYKEPGDSIDDGDIYGPFGSFEEAESYAEQLNLRDGGDACVQPLTAPLPIVR